MHQPTKAPDTASTVQGGVSTPSLRFSDPQNLLRAQALRAVTGAAYMESKKAVVMFAEDWRAVDYLSSDEWMKGKLVTFTRPGSPIVSSSAILRSELLRKAGKDVENQELGAKLEQAFNERVAQLHEQVPRKHADAYRMAAFIYGESTAALGYLNGPHWPRFRDY